MIVTIIPGYGDRTDYIEKATKSWFKLYGFKVNIVTFGWSGNADSYEAKWERFTNALRNSPPSALIGISAGVSVALRALQELPEKTLAVVAVCGPVSDQYLKPQVLSTSYPVLKNSLENLSLEGMKTDRVLTLRPLRDKVVPPQAVILPGAKNIRMLSVGHAASLLLALRVYHKAIAKFIKEKA